MSTVYIYVYVYVCMYVFNEILYGSTSRPIPEAPDIGGCGGGMQKQGLLQTPGNR